MKAYAVVMSDGKGGHFIAPVCKTPECAREAVSPFEGSQVLGMAEIEVIEPVSGLRYRLGEGVAND